MSWRGRPLGILGGMGPLASAELLRTIYRLNVTGPEQEAPVCLLYSDPTFPDRTEAILQGSTRELSRKLERSLETLLAMGADRIVVACVTIHHVVPALPEELRRRVISLIDLVIDEVLAAPRPLLLLCTHGTRIARIFERHPRWELVSPWISYLEERDQVDLHQWIYRLKANYPPRECIDWLKALLLRYDDQGVIFGCTELHLLQQTLEESASPIEVVDPLLAFARLFKGCPCPGY